MRLRASVAATLAISVLCLAAPAARRDSRRATPVTRTFRAGDTNGSVVTDGGVNGAAPNTSYGTAGYIAVNVTSGGHALIRFENVFGNGPHQIPYGSTITSATVKLYLSGVPTSGSDIAQLHRMLVPWQDTATYNSMTTSGPGHPARQRGVPCDRRRVVQREHRLDEDLRGDRDRPGLGERGPRLRLGAVAEQRDEHERDAVEQLRGARGGRC